jgi:hypothetical protein
MQDIDPLDLIEFATRWAALGDAVAAQVTRVIAGDDDENNVNPNAIQFAQSRLRGLNDEIDSILSEFLQSVGS